MNVIKSKTLVFEGNGMSHCNYNLNGEELEAPDYYLVFGGKVQ